jgi:hypothetical protein
MRRRDLVILVEPGEYREQITLANGVRLESRVPRGATIRLPASIPDAADVAAVVARNVSGAGLVGFRISGDSTTSASSRTLCSELDRFNRQRRNHGATRAAVEFAAEAPRP